MVRSSRDKFHIVLKDDYFNKGDVISYAEKNFIVTKTFRRTWWRLFLFKIGILRDKFFLNNSERCVIKVKEIK